MKDSGAFEDDGASVADSAAALTNKPVPPVIVKGFEPTPLQQSFQPGSTPVHYAHRFMVIGFILLIY